MKTRSTRSLKRFTRWSIDAGKAATQIARCTKDTLALVLMALGDALIGERLSDRWGWHAIALRDMAERQLKKWHGSLGERSRKPKLTGTWSILGETVYHRWQMPLTRAHCAGIMKKNIVRLFSRPGPGSDRRQRWTKFDAAADRRVGEKPAMQPKSSATTPKCGTGTCFAVRPIGQRPANEISRPDARHLVARTRLKSIQCCRCGLHRSPAGRRKYAGRPQDHAPGRRDGRGAGRGRGGSMFIAGLLNLPERQRKNTWSKSRLETLTLGIRAFFGGRQHCFRAASGSIIVAFLTAQPLARNLCRGRGCRATAPAS